MIAGALLVAIDVIAYAPVVGYGLVEYDDQDYVADNPHVRAGITLRGVRWAFTTGHMANWHPLTWLSHMLDVQLFGANAGAYHAVNLLFHVLNTLLLFAVLERMSGSVGRSAVVAALFAVHPMHVESVAWVSERKDVLSTFFWLLTTWAYVAYVAAPRRRSYVLVVACFALGLMSKPMLVTLPCVLLLLDYWPLRRPMRLDLIREKIPLLAMATVSSVVTVIVQRQGGAVMRLELVPLPVRVANALVSYAQYIRKMLWPVDLAAMYPLWRQMPDPVTLGAAVGVLLLISATAVRLYRRYPYVLVGWLWFVGTLVPVIGIVQVGVQSMADRYSYVPLVGLFVIVAWGSHDVAVRFPAARAPMRAAAAMLVVACTWLALQQVRSWRSSEVLWRRAMAVTPDNYFAQANLAYVLWKDGRSAEAIPLFRESVRIRPDFAEVRNNLGVALAGQGALGEALAEFRAAVRLDSSYATARENLAATEARLRGTDSALAPAASRVREHPGDMVARNEYGAALAAQGRLEEAAEQFREALRLAPGQPDLHFNLGAVLQKQGRTADAAREYEAALRLRPGHGAARAALDALTLQPPGAR